MEPLVEALRMENFTAASARGPTFLLSFRKSTDKDKSDHLIYTCAVTRALAGCPPTANKPQLHSDAIVNLAVRGPQTGAPPESESRRAFAMLGRGALPIT